jgi:translation initiation factor IF-3
MDTDKAQEIAASEGLDLVEVAPDSKPPVCRIMDFGKYKYQQSKKAKDARKRQHVMHLKEIKVRPKIDEHDYQFKLRNARKFLEHHDKVKVTMIFRGRERIHIELGEKVLNRMTEDLSDVSQVEQGPKIEGRDLIVTYIPK